MWKRKRVSHYILLIDQKHTNNYFISHTINYIIWTYLSSLLVSSLRNMVYSEKIQSTQNWYLICNLNKRWIFSIRAISTTRQPYCCVQVLAMNIKISIAAKTLLQLMYILFSHKSKWCGESITWLLSRSTGALFSWAIFMSTLDIAKLVYCTF